MTLTNSPEYLTTIHTTTPLTLGQTVAVEACKVVDRVSGVLLMAFGVVLTAFFGLSATRDSLASAASIGGFIAMAASMLLITNEFTRGQAVPTLPLDPHRGRVLMAKTIVSVGLALAFGCWTLIVSVIGRSFAAAFVGTVAPTSVEPGGIAIMIATMFAGIVFMSLLGLAWGLLTRNALALIVVMLVWPAIAQQISQSSDLAQRVVTWFYPEPMIAMSYPSFPALRQLGSSALAWIVLPGAIGAWRLLRRRL